MKKIIHVVIFVAATFLMISCSSSKNSSGVKATRTNLAGTWTISDINVNVPSDLHITNVFDEAPYSDFKGSVWELIRNGKGSFTLPKGTKQPINWSIYNKSDSAQLQFKKLNGMKARNVDEGYRLYLENISSDHFTAKSPVDVGNGNTGFITYTFTKQ